MTVGEPFPELDEIDIPIWAGLPVEAKQELWCELERLELPGGAVLFEEGEAADGLYLLLSGALGISIRDGAGNDRRIARAFPPETIGEMALISDAPRSATVTALRDSILLKLSRHAYDTLVERWPPAMLYLARLLTDRLRAATRQGSLPYAPTTFAVLPVTAGVDADRVGDGLLAELRRLYGAKVDLLREPPAGASEDWFHRFESGRDRVLYVSDAAGGGWADLCIRRADHVVMLGRPQEPVLPLPPSLAQSAGGWRRHDLVLIQAADAPRPRAAHPSFARLAIDLRLQLREGAREDLRRLARLVSGRAVGLVLAGGGARGFAHLGVMRALAEHHIPVDLIGGTSIGAVIAAGCAMGWTLAEMEARLADAFVHSGPLTDYTLPLVALVRGRRVDAVLTRHFGDVAIEDLWLPFFAVSSNLTTGLPWIHSGGPLWQALRASIAIPGLLPPVVTADGVLVDGAMTNNLPADVMAQFQRGSVLAVDVARDVVFRTAPQTASRSLLRRILRLPLEAPDIVSLLYRAATVSSDAQTARARALAKLVVHPPLADVDLRAWRSFQAVAEIGYRHTLRMIEEGAFDGFRD